MIAHALSSGHTARLIKYNTISQVKESFKKVTAHVDKASEVNSPRKKMREGLAKGPIGKAAGASAPGDALCAGDAAAWTGTTLADADADAEALDGRTSVSATGPKAAGASAVGDALCAGLGDTLTGTTLADAEADADAQVGRTLVGAVGPTSTPSGKARMHLEPAGKQGT
eukprot:s5051_g8.t1